MLVWFKLIQELLLLLFNHIISKKNNKMIFELTKTTLAELNPQPRGNQRLGIPVV